MDEAVGGFLMLALALSVLLPIMVAVFSQDLEN